MGRLDRSPRRCATQASAFENFSISSQIVINNYRAYGDMTIRILTAPDPFPSDMPADAAADWSSFTTELNGAHDAMAGLSTDGTNRVIGGANHVSIKDVRTDVALATVDDVIAKIRRLPQRPASWVDESNVATPDFSRR